MKHSVAVPAMSLVAAVGYSLQMARQQQATYLSRGNFTEKRQSGTRNPLSDLIMNHRYRVLYIQLILKDLRLYTVTDGTACFYV